MTAPTRWGQTLASLGTAEQETLLGTSLSRRFTTLPLWLSHPANIGAFYGFLVSLTLLLPYRFAGEDTNGWLANWVFHASILMVACLVMGFSSLLLIRWSKRFPMTPPRILLYPMPFFRSCIADTWANGHGECSNGVGVVAVVITWSNVRSLVMGTSLAVAVHA